MALEPNRAIRLARALRDLRDTAWPDVELTQAQLAKALSVESRVASATLSSWESLTNPKTPTASRLSAYARFFATRRSLTPEPHLIPEKDLTPDELERYHELEADLIGLLQADQLSGRSTFAFEEGPITILCPEAPADQRGQLAEPRNPNFNRLQLFADQDALLEMWGHVRAENPALTPRIRIRLPSEVVADDLSGHVILLGGIGWNRLARRFQTAIGAVPITQVDDGTLDTGEIFRVKDADGERKFVPEWDDPDAENRELIEDVGHIARLRNPFQSSRTLTICNGIHSRGVLGAVRCLTDASVREANERYLADRFPDGRFAMLVRVPVVANETLSPDLQYPDTRLYEWAAPKDEYR
jgi:transcriptional regulator with XRE-family HTH domain